MKPKRTFLIQELLIASCHTMTFCSNNNVWFRLLDEMRWKSIFSLPKMLMKMVEIELFNIRGYYRDAEYIHMYIQIGWKSRSRRKISHEKITSSQLLWIQSEIFTVSAHQALHIAIRWYIKLKSFTFHGFKDHKNARMHTYMIHVMSCTKGQTPSYTVDIMMSL